MFLLIALFGLALEPRSACAFTAADAAQMFKAYNRAFYFTQGTNGFFRNTTLGGKVWFWERAEEMEMVLDVYEQTSNRVCLTMFSNLFNGFLTDHGRDWQANDYNDDIMWMVIACARAAQLTGNHVYCDTARANFDLCYARAWSSDLGGGLWWKTDKRSKNACVNSPGAIAACLLYQIYGDTNYLAKAEQIYQWERATLFDTNNGAVYDNIDREGHLATFNLTYNQGTFLGAANFLGHTNDAMLAADFMVKNLSDNGLMPSYKTDGDAAGFNGIGARWLAMCMRQRGWEAKFQSWLQANANAAWRCRRASDDLAWSRWAQHTPDGELRSWACCNAVVLMHVVPPTKTSDGDKRKSPANRLQ